MLDPKLKPVDQGFHIKKPRGGVFAQSPDNLFKQIPSDLKSMWARHFKLFHTHVDNRNYLERSEMHHNCNSVGRLCVSASMMINACFPKTVQNQYMLIRLRKQSVWSRAAIYAT